MEIRLLHCKALGVDTGSQMFVNDIRMLRPIKFSQTTYADAYNSPMFTKFSFKFSFLSDSLILLSADFIRRVISFDDASMKTDALRIT